MHGGSWSCVYFLLMLCSSPVCARMWLWLEKFNLFIIHSTFSPSPSPCHTTNQRTHSANKKFKNFIYLLKKLFFYLLHDKYFTLSFFQWWIWIAYYPFFSAAIVTAKTPQSFRSSSFPWKYIFHNYIIPCWYWVLHGNTRKFVIKQFIAFALLAFCVPFKCNGTDQMLRMRRCEAFEICWVKKPFNLNLKLEYWERNWLL